MLLSPIWCMIFGIMHPIRAYVPKSCLCLSYLVRIYDIPLREERAMALREETKEEKFWREFWADREGPKKEHGRPVETSDGRPPNVISFEEYPFKKNLEQNQSQPNHSRKP